VSQTLIPTAHVELYIEVADFYAHQMPLLEEGELEAFVQTFTEDCVFGYDGAWQVAGREALLGGVRANVPRYGTSRIRHWFENRRVAVREDGTIESAATSLVSVTSEDGEVSFEPSCVVRDELVRTEQGLRAKSRIIRHDLPDAGRYFARLAASHG
jgi:3-phenylpropionate/cinnamic acid dioxygenase small subunit